MIETVSAAEAKTHLSELLSRVAHGKERIVIERRGKPVAALVPVDELYDMRYRGAQPPQRRSMADLFEELAKLPSVDDEIIDKMVEDIYAERRRGVPGLDGAQ